MAVVPNVVLIHFFGAKAIAVRSSLRRLVAQLCSNALGHVPAKLINFSDQEYAISI